MHSSRMRTARSLTVCCSLLPGGLSAWSRGTGGLLGLGGGGCLPGPGGMSAWSRGRGFSLVWGGVILGLGGVGGVSPCWGVFLVPGGSPWSWGVSAWSGGGFLGPGEGGSPWSAGGVLPAGGGLLGLVGVVSPWSWGGSTETPPVYRITDTCKNLTLATTSLRPVINIYISLFQTCFRKEPLTFSYVH